MRPWKPSFARLSRPMIVQGAAIGLAGIGLIAALAGMMGKAPAGIGGLASTLLVLAGAMIWTVMVRAESLREQADQLQASQERLRELSHFRQQFLANMSHEFRTPLNAIQGFSQAILHRQSEMSDEQVRDYVAIIEKSARDLAILTDNVLDLSKLDSQKFELAVRDVDFTRLVCDSVGQHSARAAERSIKLTCDMSEDWTVRADSRGIKRCLDALLCNGIKFSEDGSEVTIRSYRRGRRTFVLEVADLGAGMEPEELNGIWMVYARSSETKKTDQVGAGLGLAITRALMDAHNGFIEIDSEAGKGTTVRLCFPNTMIVSPTFAPSADELQAAG